MRLILFVAFFLSGLAGLAYETVWSRYLGLFVGHSAYAQVLVLVIFLGGMALGALLVGQRSARLRRPLRAYALAELGVGLLAFVFHEVFVGVTGWGYATLIPAVGGGAIGVAARWALAAALILPQSVLLGATFPLMSAGLLRDRAERPGHTLALLYFVNSLGAALGALLAGFWFIALAGLPGTLLIAGGLNVLVAAGVWLAAADERAPPLPTAAAGGAASAAPAELPPAVRALWRLLLFVSFGTAVASFIYEIAWIRMLSLVLGSATHSFELMLSAFILGLSLGALWMRRRADRFQEPLRALGIIQWAMGLAALATLPIYVASFGWTATLFEALQRSEAGYLVYTLSRYGVALAVMLPSTFCAGMTLPLITRTLVHRGAGERAIGWVYGVNTLGSIAGVSLAALVLMPLVGLKALLMLGAAADIALGMLLLWRVRAREAASTLVWGAAGAAAVALVAVGTLAGMDRLLLVSGVFRTGRLHDPNTTEVLYYADGRTATVGAVDRLGPSGRRVVLSTNGKPDASMTDRWISGTAATPEPLATDEPTQLLLALVTLAHAPEARTAAVIGYGSGMTTHMLLGSPRLESVTTIEIEPRMIEGARAYHPANRRALEDPRSRIVIGDARSELALRGGYDVVVSEPSNPWVSGVSGLFTVEFYEQLRRSLAPGGVLGQWLHTYEIDDGLVLSVLAALHRVFAAYRVYYVNASDLLIVAAADGELPEPNWEIFDEPAVRADLRHTYPWPRPYLSSLRLLDHRVIGPLLETWGYANSDFYPHLDLGAERTRFLGHQAEGVEAIASATLSVATPFLPPRAPPDPATPAPVPAVPAMAALARAGRLHAALNGEPPADTAGDALSGSAWLRDALYRVQRLRNGLDAAAPPADWKAWLADAVAVEGLLHGGTVGWTDDAFFADLHRFLVRHRAPEPLRAAARYIEGARRRDYAGVVAALPPLVEATTNGDIWVAPRELYEFGVVSHLALGDVAGAGALAETLRPHVPQADDDLRLRIVRAHLEASRLR